MNVLIAFATATGEYPAELGGQDRVSDCPPEEACTQKSYGLHNYRKLYAAITIKIWIFYCHHHAILKGSVNIAANKKLPIVFAGGRMYVHFECDISSN